MIECSLQDMTAKCEFECDEEGFVCEHCKRLIRPACAGLVPGLEFLADTGSEEDLISKSDCRAHFPDVPIGPSTRPVSLITANGPGKGNESVKLEVPEIISTLECYVLESTPPVCSVGRRYMDEGFDFHWYAGKAPYFVTPDGKKLYCKLRGDGSLATPAKDEKTAHTPVAQGTSGFRPSEA